MQIMSLELNGVQALTSKVLEGCLDIAYLSFQDFETRSENSIDVICDITVTEKDYIDTNGDYTHNHAVVSEEKHEMTDLVQSKGEIRSSAANHGITDSNTENCELLNSN